MEAGVRLLWLSAAFGGVPSPCATSVHFWGWKKRCEVQGAPSCGTVLINSSLDPWARAPFYSSP